MLVHIHPILRCYCLFWIYSNYEFKCASKWWVNFYKWAYISFRCWSNFLVLILRNKYGMPFIPFVSIISGGRSSGDWQCNIKIRNCPNGRRVQKAVVALDVAHTQLRLKSRTEAVDIVVISATSSPRPDPWSPKY